MKNNLTSLKELHLWTDDSGNEADPSAMEPYLRWINETDRILDVGCGDGRVLRFLRTRGYNANGVDINHELVSLCQSDGLKVELGDAQDVVTRDSQRYEVFSMLDFVEHVPLEVVIGILKKISEKPGTKVWIQTPNLDSIMGFKFWFHMPTHVLPLNPWVIRKILKRMDFTIISEWTDWGGIPWIGFRRWVTQKLLIHLFGPALAKMFFEGGNICFVAQTSNSPTCTSPPSSSKE